MCVCVLQTQQGQGRIKKHRGSDCTIVVRDTDGRRRESKDHNKDVENRTREELELEEMHEILEGRRNKEIKLRLTGEEEEESTGSIGN